MKSTKSFGPSSASPDVCPVCRRKPYERHGVVNVCEHYDKPFISDEEHLRTVKQLYENAKFDGASTIRLTVEQVAALLSPTPPAESLVMAGNAVGRGGESEVRSEHNSVSYASSRTGTAVNDAPGAGHTASREPIRTTPR